MKVKIYKYELPDFPGSVINIEEKIVKVLSVQYQNDIPTMWALVEVEDKSCTTQITALGTGWEVPVWRDHIGSLQDKNGYVWHYFIVPEESKVLKTYDTTNLFDEFAALAQAFGKVGVSEEEASKAFDMEGLFDACM